MIPSSDYAARRPVPSRRVASRGILRDSTNSAASNRGNRLTYEGVVRQLAASWGHDVRARLTEIAAPTLVIHGDLDRAVPFAMGEALAAGIPDARFVVFPGVRHTLLQERPEEFQPSRPGFPQRRQRGIMRTPLFAPPPGPSRTGSGADSLTIARAKGATQCRSCYSLVAEPELS